VKLVTASERKVFPVLIAAWTVFDTRSPNQNLNGFVLGL
jgi:hypothetical protein